jgi:3-deoxy-manno-octulosonate cytidylyltransferase (CMP-KDO synthetase)
MSKAVGIIPARWRSTRFPGKPLHLIANKPLLWHVWNRCRRAKQLDKVIIATDDMRIAKEAFDWDAEVAMTSPKHQSGTDRVAEVVRKTRQYDIIINIQGDEPLTEPALLDRMVETLRSNRKIDIVTAAHPFANAAEASSPHQVKVIVDRDNNALYFSRYAVPFPRNRSAPIKYLRHQGIYGFRRKCGQNRRRWSARNRSSNCARLKMV